MPNSNQQRKLGRVAEDTDGRIDRHAAGLGSVTAAMVEQRARELASIAGRSEVTRNDRDAARRELLGIKPGEAQPADVPVEITSWDQAPAERGQQHLNMLPADDQNVSDLVEEGVEEAEHEQRLSAHEETEPDEEP